MKNIFKSLEAVERERESYYLNKTKIKAERAFINHTKRQIMYQES